MKRKRLILIFLVVFALVAIACIAIFRRPLAIAYHQWRMEAAYNTIFGDPEPASGGLTRYDVTDVDVDAVLEAYEGHRQSLIDLDALRHLTSSFPSLAADGTEERLAERTAFLSRMWDVFPNHRHYYLANDGTFKTWIPVEQRPDWERFLDRESKTNQ